MAFEILAKKLQVEDTGAHQEMIRMNYETFCVILTATLIILSLAISVWAPFERGLTARDSSSFFFISSYEYIFLNRVSCKTHKIFKSHWTVYSNLLK